MNTPGLKVLAVSLEFVTPQQSNRAYPVGQVLTKDTHN